MVRDSGWPRFIEGGGVVVTYRAGEVYAELRSYTSCTGNQAGSARLQHLPPSLLAPARATRSLTRSDAVLMSTKKKVLEARGWRAS
jgi:hypothetical protein